MDAPGSKYIRDVLLPILIVYTSLPPLLLLVDTGRGYHRLGILDLNRMYKKHSKIRTAMVRRMIVHLLFNTKNLFISLFS